MTVKMSMFQRPVVTETYSESSDEEFSSQEDDAQEAQLAHAVEDTENSVKQDNTPNSPQKRKLDADSNDEDASDDEEGNKIEENEESGASDADAAEGDEGEDGANAGWADSIAKILSTNKPQKKKILVLSKAKKLTDPPKAKPKSAGFQVEKEDGAIAEEQIEEGDKNKEEKVLSKGPPRKKKREILSLRVKPNVLDKDRERILAKIATKGVVQLFNSVKQQQKEIKTRLDEAGPLEAKRDKVLKSIDKRSFLDNLMGEKGKSVDVGSQVSTAKGKVKAKTSASTDSTWCVFRDDFMMGSNKIKDWDKELETEDHEQEAQMEVEQELESD